MNAVEEIDYPAQDGLPMSDSTQQFRWIGLIMWNASVLFAEREDVFVAGDHLIYPIEGDLTTRTAPDVYVAFGAPKGDRNSYMLWKENNIFPQVVFEVWSPGNSQRDFSTKHSFYERFAVEEYYVIYPDTPRRIVGYIRKRRRLVEVRDMDGFTSPRLGITFQSEDGEIGICGPDGKPWQPPSLQIIEFQKELKNAKRQARVAARKEREAQRQVEEAARKEREAQRQTERERAEKEALRAKLRELGFDPDTMT